MVLASYAYRFITKRFSSLFVVLTVGAIATDLVVDKGGDYLFKQYNKGKLWEDIKDKYVDDLAFYGITLMFPQILIIVDFVPLYLGI